MKKFFLLVLLFISFRSVSAQYSFTGFGYTGQFMPISDGLDKIFIEFQHGLDQQSLEISNSVVRSRTLHGFIASQRYDIDELIFTSDLSYSINSTYASGIDLLGNSYYHKFQFDHSKISGGVYIPLIRFNRLKAGPAFSLDYNRFTVKRSFQKKIYLVFFDREGSRDYLSAELKFPVEFEINDAIIEFTPFVDIPYVRKNLRDLHDDINFLSPNILSDEELAFNPLMIGVNLVVLFPYSR